MDKKPHKLYELTKGIIKENPLFVLLLGTCPSLATTTSLEGAIGMGFLFTFVLIGSNVVRSLLRKIIPSQIKIPCYIVIIATFVTIVKMLSEAFLPELYSTLGVFLSLIVVNCIVLGRAEAFASKNGVGASLLDGIGMGIGYTLALVIMALVREILGTGGITIGEIFTFLPYVSFTPLENYAMSIFTMPAGAFLVLGIILAILAFNANRKANLEKVNAKLEKEKLAKLASEAKEA